MRKIFTFLLCAMFASTSFGQKPNDLIMKTDTKPVIDGVLDEGLWDEANVNPIDKNFQSETPTLGEAGETNWRMLWDEDGMYIFVTVMDDIFLPTSAGDGNGWEYDHPELYFDTNFELADGGGASANANGHYQVAPFIHTSGTDMNTGGELNVQDDGVEYAIIVDGTNYNVEYFVPFSKLQTNEGIGPDIELEIGFDVTIIDNDNTADVNTPERNRAVWANVGDIDESWNNMDDAGIIELDGATVYYIDEIILTGGDITVNKETFQIGIELISDFPPNPPTDKTLKWFIDEASTAQATISSKGVVTPISNGTLVVYAMSGDEFVTSNTVNINISGQIASIDKFNYIDDGYFNDTEDGETPDGWPSGDGLNGHTAYVEDGVFYFSPDSALANPWDMKVRQAVDVDRLADAAGEEFLIAFKMWATEECSFQLVLEQQSNSWLHWGNGSTATSQFDNAVPNGENTRWDLTVTTVPTWFKMSFIANNLDGNRADFGFQPGTIGAILVAVDSLYLIEAADSAQIAWDYTSVEQSQLSNSTLSVYPNPATDRLNITLTGASANSKIAIYNSVGLKMEEIEVVGNHHVVDVSNYSSGLYFVKSNDKVVKFVR